MESGRSREHSSRRIQHGTGTGTGYPGRGHQLSRRQGHTLAPLQYLDSDVQINLTLSFYSAAAAGAIIVLTRMTSDSYPK